MACKKSHGFPLQQQTPMLDGTTALTGLSGIAPQGSASPPAEFHACQCGDKAEWCEVCLENLLNRRYQEGWADGNDAGQAHDDNS